ncbi:MAG TPA: PAS domain-containing sensor histidine kinase [Bacteroidales bacterium]|nr:PAS domain-containing sensor histidine kinase [Bacteroidales bacterium]
MARRENRIPHSDVLQAIIHSPGLGIVVFDKSLTIRYANPAFATLTDSTQKALYSKKLNEVIKNDKHQTLKAIAQEKSDTGSLELNCDEAGKPSVMLDISSADEGNGKLFTGFTRKLYGGEKDTHQAQKKVTDLKTQFLSVASHEFKMPVAGMISSLNLIRRYLNSAGKAWENFPHRQRIEKHLNNVNYSVRNLSDTMNKFLSLQNIESGKIRPHYESFHLLHFLEEHKAGMQNSHSHDVRLLYDCHTCKANIHTDKNFLNNILTNLVSNAIKYSKADQKVSVTANIDANNLHISVSDSGIGIPESEQEKIFDYFYRAENTRNHEGTGLGLTITKTYIDLLNGHITFSSKKGRGTTFNLNVPINQ